MKKIALAGNPNSGKTTLFNTLTGSAQYVGNWPGVTVEKKEGKIKGNKDITLVDLPGIYSLSPYTLEEVVARNFILDEKPDAIINIIDATNIERNLYLTTQLMELKIPVVIALNMMDIVEKSGKKIDVEELSFRLKCPIVEISALKNRGTEVLMSAVDKAIADHKVHGVVCFREDVKYALDKIEGLIESSTGDHADWYAVKLFERDPEIQKKLNLDASTMKLVEDEINIVEKLHDDDSEGIITTQRYDYVEMMVTGAVERVKGSSKMSISDKIDRVVTNRWLALPIFAIVMWIVYSVAMSGVGLAMTDWVNDVLFGEIIPPAVESFLVAINCAEWLQSLILNGIIAGVGAVLGFLPQMIVLFVMLAILEDIGYMARIAFVLDKIFRKFGLSGKSFIPILISTGCGVPGIMATRTIENESDRRMTIMLATFVPCSAKLPIFALLAGAVFGDGSLPFLWTTVNTGTLVAFSMYFLGIAAVIICGIFLKKLKYFRGDAAPFIMELPAYHIPSGRNVVRHTWDRTLSFVKKAGTIILLSSIGIWIVSSLTWKFQYTEDIEVSILASIGRVVAPIFAPLGWGDWKAAVATVMGFVAKENIVSTFGVLFGMSEVAENGLEIWPQVGALFTPISAYSFMAFNLLCAPCFAAIGAIKREMGSAKWTWRTIGFQCGFAYLVALLINVIGNLVA